MTIYQVITQRRGLCPDWEGMPGVSIREAQVLADAMATRLADKIREGNANVGIYDNSTHAIVIVHGRSLW